MAVVRGGEADNANDNHANVSVSNGPGYIKEKLVNASMLETFTVKKQPSLDEEAMPVNYYYVHSGNLNGGDVNEVVDSIKGKNLIKKYPGLTGFLKNAWESSFVILSFFLLPLGECLPNLVRTALLEALLERVKGCGNDKICAMNELEINNTNTMDFIKGMDKCGKDSSCMMDEILMPRTNLMDIDLTWTKVMLLTLLVTSLALVTASCIADKYKPGAIGYLKIGKGMWVYFRVCLVHLVLSYLLPHVAAYVANEEPGRHVPQLTSFDSYVFALLTLWVDLFHAKGPAWKRNAHGSAKME
ncbi:MAG: hypothetical protein M1831_000184 [Alyxoria varia]|nr:MAG: hypothetical protein M1831_000184 [Alyxoria varia]